MRFDIDYARAKDMATRLQDFMSASPKKLTRSSAIEAVARTLGFNNRNEMAARIDAAPASDEIPDEAGPEEAAYAALETLLGQEIRKAADDLVAEGRKVLPEGDFRDAMHAENPDEGIHTLMIVEDHIVHRLLADPRYRALITGALVDNWEYDGARKEGLEGSEALARAIVNEAMETAENSLGRGRRPCHPGRGRTGCRGRPGRRALRLSASQVSGRSSPGAPLPEP